MGKRTLRITITVHPNGTLHVLIEWICSNLSRGFELATPPLLGISFHKRHGRASIDLSSASRE